MTQRVYVFDAYGTLFDVHAAIARHRAQCGPDSDRLSEIWRAKQLEYSWTLTLAGQYVEFWTLTGAVKAAQIGALLDGVLSVDTIRLYKPLPQVYAMATAAFPVAPGNVMFVSSNRWDVMGAVCFGFRGVWVNRADMPEEYSERAPHHRIASLSGLPGLI